MNKSTYEMRISKLTGKAIHDYTMIQADDKILVALSGGKDSLTLLHILELRKKWLPIDYHLFAVHVKANIPCASPIEVEKMEHFCSERKIPFIIKEIEIPKTKRSQCFFCSWNRRKVLFNTCEELGCNKLALGHHKDDIIETLLLNLFYHGEISTMPPKLEFFNGKLTMIRPLAYVEEAQTRRYAAEHEFSVATCSQEYALTTKRLLIKQLVKEVKKNIPGVKSNLFNSMRKGIIEGYTT